MEYYSRITLKDGRPCVLRHGSAKDAEGALGNFIRTHEETDNLLSRPDEIKLTSDEEGKYLEEKAASGNEAEILAEVDGRIVGTAGIEAAGKQEKIRHRCDFGISIEKEYWGLGIGRALTEACIECAKKAGYEQMELQVVADNERAIDMYRAAGFTEFGRNPRGFRKRGEEYQELVYMRLELY